MTFSVAIHNDLPYHFWWPNHAKHHAPSVEAMDFLVTILHPKDDQDFDVEDLEAIVTSNGGPGFSQFQKKHSKHVEFAALIFRYVYLTPKEKDEQQMMKIDSLLVLEPKLYLPQQKLKPISLFPQSTKNKIAQSKSQSKNKNRTTRLSDKFSGPRITTPGFGLILVHPSAFSGSIIKPTYKLGAQLRATLIKDISLRDWLKWIHLAKMEGLWPGLLGRMCTNGGLQKKITVGCISCFDLREELVESLPHNATLPFRIYSSSYAESVPFH